MHSVYPVRDLYLLESERRLNPNAIPHGGSGARDRLKRVRQSEESEL